MGTSDSKRPLRSDTDPYWLDNTLARMDKLCQRRQVRLTAQRRAVITLMLNAERAMSAYDLLDQLKTLEPNAKPPTIYRALDFLINQGFVHKVESINRYVLCSHFNDTHHVSILFICFHCQMIVERHSSVIEQELHTLANQNNFLNKYSVLEIQGACQNCQSSKRSIIDDTPNK